MIDHKGVNNWSKFLAKHSKIKNSIKYFYILFGGYQMALCVKEWLI